MTRLVAGTVLTILLASGCSNDSPGDRANVDTAPPVAAAPTTTPDSATGPAKWRVTPHGLGPVTAGMSLADAAISIGASPDIAPAERECSYVRAPGAPAGVSFMIRDGIIARIDVDSTGVSTPEGVGIGDTEDRVRAAYAGRITERPHKYTDGKYLLVRPDTAAAATHLIVFETDGRVVTSFAAGRLPEVEWVEGCS